MFSCFEGEARVLVVVGVRGGDVDYIDVGIVDQSAVAAVRDGFLWGPTETGTETGR